MSTPTARPPVSWYAYIAAPIEPSVSARTQDAPPCSNPYGWVFPSTGIEPTTRSAAASSIVIPIRLASAPRPSMISASMVQHPTFLPAVEAVPDLAPQPPGLDQRDEQPRRLEPRPVRDSQRPRDVQPHVQPDEVGQLQRTDRVPVSQHHRPVDVGRLGDAVLQHPDRFETQRHTQPRGGEAGLVPYHHG